MVCEKFGQACNEENYENLFHHFEPGQRIKADFMEFGSENFMILVDSISSFYEGLLNKNKFKSEAIRAMREWSCLHGAPYRMKTDNGPDYRGQF